MTLELNSLLLGFGMGVVVMLFWQTWTQGTRHRADLAAVEALRQQAEAETAEARRQIAELRGDWQTTHQQLEQLNQQLEQTAANREQLAQALAEMKTELAKAEEAAQQAAVATAQVPTAPAPSPEASAPTTAVSAPVATAEQDMKLLNGVGNAYAKRLKQAGITTFAQLATHTADQLQEIIKPQAWQAVNFEAWLEEARLFVANPDLVANGLTQIPNLNAPEAQVLYEAGIRTLADLAAQNEGRLRELIANPSDKFEPAAWLAEAKKLA